MLALAVLLISASGVLCRDVKPQIKVTFEEEGKFHVIINQKSWFQSDDIFYRNRNQLHSFNQKTTSLVHKSLSYEKDDLGAHTKYSFNYSTKDDKTTDFIANIQVYDEFIVFEQTFPTELQGTSSGNADGLISGFPTFNIKDDHGGAGYAHWISWFYETTAESTHDHRRLLVAPGFATPQYGKWDSSTRLVGGIGGSGVTAIYDEEMQTTVIMSPLNNFMASSHISERNGTLSYGIMGNVTSIPAGFSLKTILFVSNSGVNQAMSAWGELLRGYYHKPPASDARARDITLQYLGYSTDNGAYYYYHTDADSDYQQTLLRLHAYFQEIALPVKYILLDSWWYYKGSNGGVSNWTARPDIFPDGISALTNATGWLVQAHNRYWARDNIYSTSNGGVYQFIEDPVKDGAAPDDRRFWTDLLRGPREQWNLVVYEQDWLFNEFYEYVSQMLESVSTGRDWLLAMGVGADANSVRIQYCMPYIRHLLQSVEVSSVTQGRASDDYVVSPYDGVDNWKIGGQAMLLEALGLAASKDTFWSSSYQPGNPYGEDRFEPYPRLQSAVTSLSAGPVAISDGRGFVDKSLVMKACREDGRLLSPSAPATVVDAVFLQASLSPANGPVGPVGEVWFAPTQLADLRFGSLFAAELAQDWPIRPMDVGYPATDNQWYLVREANETATSRPIRWSNSQPLVLKKCGRADFQLFSISPVLTGGWTFLGELEKWVPFSAARVQSLTHSQHEMVVEVAGTRGEVVRMTFVSPEGKVIEVPCKFNSAASTSEKTSTMRISSSGVCNETN